MTPTTAAKIETPSLLPFEDFSETWRFCAGKIEDSNCKLLLHLEALGVIFGGFRDSFTLSPQAIRSPGHVLPLR